MDLDERIARRQRTTREGGLVAHWGPLDPTVHLDEPVGRGPTVERLLDALDPLFDGELPADVYVHGPAGSGKSAVVTSLVGALARRLASPADTIGTTTRATNEPTPGFGYVDARRDGTPFRLHRAALAAVTDESVPKRGVGTDALRSRLQDALADRPGAVLVVDHVGEAGTPDVERVREVFDPLGGSLALVSVGRTPPESLGGSAPARTVSIDSYHRDALVDVVTTRASEALRHGLSHGHARRLADWAEGDAHDALAALFGAVDNAQRAERDRLTDADLDRGTDAVPQRGAPLARAFALPENRQRVLDHLLALDLADAELEVAAERIASNCELTAATVTRFLYELAEDGILARVRPEEGRGPSRVEPRFPTLVYRRLRERRS